MSIKNILALAALINFSTYNFIQAEVIYDVNIPRINVAEIVGEWYLVASTQTKDQRVCMSNIVKQQSENSFTMNITAVLKPEAKGNVDHSSKIIYEANLISTMKNDSNIIIAKGGDPVDRSTSQSIVIFDVVYDSYMAMYTTETMSIMNTNTYGNMFVFARPEKLSNVNLGNIMNSNIYKQGVNSQNTLRSVDYTVCQ